jgi:hypothetical protein
MARCAFRQLAECEAAGARATLGAALQTPLPARVLKAPEVVARRRPVARSRRSRSAARHGRVPRRQRPAGVYPGGSAGDRGEGSARSRARRAAERAVRLPAAQVHRQFGARRLAEGIRPLRLADRARHPRTDSHFKRMRLSVAKSVGRGQASNSGGKSLLRTLVVALSGGRVRAG